MLKQSLIFALALMSGASTAATFVVDNVSDTLAVNDDDPGDGICRNAFSGCSLRTAIQEANALDGPDTIEFSVAGTITLEPRLGRLPSITERVLIDGYSAPGAPDPDEAESIFVAPPVIVLDGSELSGASDSGFTLSGEADRTNIRGLSIVSFSGSGIEIQFGVDRTIVQGNYIGVRPNGTLGGNAQWGVVATAGVRNQIGNFEFLELVGLGNWIVANGRSGIRVNASQDTQVFGNVVGGNTAFFYNGEYGVEFVGGSNGQIGILAGEDIQAGSNLVRGNGVGGVFISGDAHKVWNNTIGPVVLGNPNASALAAPGSGITAGGADHLIGPNEPGEGGNYITRFQSSGIQLGTDEAAAERVGIVSNSLEANGASGVDIVVARDAVILDNFISFNSESGISVMAGNRNDFSGNSFFENDGLAIDLYGDGRTPNDTNDADGGPNNLQNSPEILSIEFNEPSDFDPAYTFEYRLNSLQGSVYPIEVQFYIADSPQSGEGLTLQATDVINGDVSHEFTGKLPRDYDGAIVAIATDADGNTSEFSLPYVVGVGPDVIFVDNFDVRSSL